MDECEAMELCIRLLLDCDRKVGGTRNWKDGIRTMSDLNYYTIGYIVHSPNVYIELEDGQEYRIKREGKIIWLKSNKRIEARTDVRDQTPFNE